MKSIASPGSIHSGHVTFGDALVALKAGYRVQRAGWNGKGMWVALTRGTIITQEQCRAGAAKHYAVEIGGTDDLVTICAHLDMRAADGSLVIGWLASQTDMLAEDWSVLP